MNANIDLTVKDIAKIVGGDLIGNKDVIVKKISRIENCMADDLTFVFQNEYIKYIDSCKASCILIPEGFLQVHNLNFKKAFIICKNVQLALLTLLSFVVESKNKGIKKIIHKTAIIDDTALIGKNVTINANCYIGKNCVINDNVVLYPNVVLYDNVHIGKNTIINSNVVCYEDTIIGDDCIIHSGAVIGADGFGFFDNADGSYKKIPQLGNVCVGNNVEIGANSTIDRALLNSTIISNGVKIDNLVHIAHNCFIDEHSALAAQVGISGSTKIGKRNRIGGQVGIAGHIEITDDVILAAKSGISKSIKKSGMYFGIPAKDKMTAFKIEACLRDLPNIVLDIEKLKNKK